MEERELEALRALVAVAERLGIPLLLVGAFARKLGFDDPRHLQPSRTRDWDFAADVPSLEAYERFLGGLHEEAGFTVSMEQGTARHPNGVELDLLPVGGVADSEGIVRRAGSTLTTLGYDEAWKTAHTIEVAHGLRLSIPDVPAYVVLKLVAWEDRRLLKHLQDVDHVLERFDTSGGERLFDEGVDPDWERVTMDVAGAWLLGREVERVFAPGVRARLDLIVQALDDTVITGVARRSAVVPSDDDVAHVRQRFETLRAAMRRTRGSMFG